MTDVLRRHSAIINATLVLVCGCSTGGTGFDDAGRSTDAGAKSDASAKSDAGRSPDGGAINATSGIEGAPCDTSHKCATKLTCVASIFTAGVCGRGCTSNIDCGKADEVCFSYSGRAADAHCVNLVKTKYGKCGVADTSLCETASCLYLPNQPIGVCISTCALDASSAALDDGGVHMSAPTGSVACDSKESCIDGVISQPMPNEGVCGVLVKRGESCGIEQGIYCDTGDICAPENPKDLASAARCFQDCSMAGVKCDKGQCVDVQGLFSYCM